MEKELVGMERNQEQQLLHLLGEKMVNVDKEDDRVWKDGETSVFTVKSAYKILQEEPLEIEGDLFVDFWRIKAQPSSQVTTWRVLEDKMTSIANLVRGICLVSNICSMCGEKEETTSHLFCTCRVVWLVWSKCYEWMRLTSTDHWEPKKHFFKILR